MSFDTDNQPNPYQTPTEASFDAVHAGTAGQLAGRINRFGAALIDGIIGIVVAVPIMFVTGYFQRAMQNQVSIVEMASMFLYGLVMFMVIHGYLLATRGQTVGKLLAKVQIVDYQSNQILPLGRLIGLRLLPVWIVSMIPFVSMLNLVDVLFIFGRERRCVHDYIAGTKVINVT